MTTVQLRRYGFAPGGMDSFVTWWRRVAPVYHQYGFDVLFAFIDRDNDEFVWAVSHPRDAGAFREAKAALNRSPEWAQATQGARPRPRVMHESVVEVEVPTHAPVRADP